MRDKTDKPALLPVFWKIEGDKGGHRLACLKSMVAALAME